MLLKRIPQILLALLILQRGYSQSYQSQRSQAFVVNVVSNALIGGIGGAINRDKDEKFYKAFLRNLVKGGVGGLIKYSAKYQTFYLAAQASGYTPPYMNSFYAPVNRLYFFLGHSVVKNAAYNRKWLDGYYCNFYGMDIRYRPREENKMQVRLSLASVAGFAEYAIRGCEFNLYKTLEHGIFVFDDPKTAIGHYEGQARFNTVVLKRPGMGILSVMPHEIVHTYQMYDLFAVSSFYDKKARPQYESRKLYKKLSPYLVVDYEVLYMTALYLPQLRKRPHYYKNYFEFEAELFATRQPVIR